MTQSLHGLRILNTRPKGQAQPLTKNITDAGGTAIECPTLHIRATNNNWISSLPDLGKVHQAIFISANAVHYCFRQLKRHHINWPAKIKVIAIGQASAKALKEYNLRVSDIPNVPNRENILALSSLHRLNNQTVLLFKGKGGRLLIEEGLLKRGANLIPLLIYQRVIPNINQQLIQSIWRDDLVDIILVTSEQSIHNLFKMFGKEALYWLQNKPYLVISERLAQTASLFGIREIRVSHPDKVMNTLFDFTQGENIIKD